MPAFKIVGSNWQTGSEEVSTEGDDEINGPYRKARGWLIAVVKSSVWRP